jgi:hypothetical protein
VLTQHPAKIFKSSNKILIQKQHPAFCEHTESVNIKICFKTLIGFLSMSTSLQIEFAAFMHLAGQILYVTENMGESLTL